MSNAIGTYWKGTVRDGKALRRLVKDYEKIHGMSPREIICRGGDFVTARGERIHINSPGVEVYIQPIKRVDNSPFTIGVRDPVTNYSVGDVEKGGEWRQYQVRGDSYSSMHIELHGHGRF